MAISDPPPIKTKYPASTTPGSTVANDPASQKLADEQKVFWNNYKDQFLKRPSKGPVNSLFVYVKQLNLTGNNGAVIHDVAVSEGMGHAMIFAVERGDWKTFDRLRAGLKIFKNPNGLSMWVINTDGSPITDKRFERLGPNHSASETEQNVAYSLLVAYERTKATVYKKEALELLNNTWRSEVVDFGGRLILLPADTINNQNWAVGKNKNDISRVTWNSSYFSPLLYRKFAKYDKAHDWNKLIDDGYNFMNIILDGIAKDPQHYGIKGINPMPAWINMSLGADGKISLISNFPNPDEPYSPDFSNEWDTIRIPIYLGWDIKDKRAVEFLKKFYAKTNIRSREDISILDRDGAKIEYENIKEMTIAAYAAGLKCIGRDVSGFIGGIEIGRTEWYYTESITYHAWLILNDRFPY